MITVVGSSNTDFTITVKRFPSLGETVLGGDFLVSGGGKGANQAAAIAKLGQEVNFIANVGRDSFGDERIRELNKIGVNTRCIKRDSAHHSGVAFIMVDGAGRNLITVSPGSNNFLRANDILKAKRCIKNSDILLLQLEVPLVPVRTAIYLAKRFYRTIILNPAPAQRLSREILSKVDILIPNEIELTMLTGIRAPDEGALFLLKLGVGCVIITLGKKGALLVNKKRTKLFKVSRAEVVDTTCAGDAFCGALAFGLDRGNSIEEAIEFANCVAAATCTRLGAQCSLPSLKEVKIWTSHFSRESKIFTAG